MHHISFQMTTILTASLRFFDEGEKTLKRNILETLEINRVSYDGYTMS